MPQKSLMEVAVTEAKDEITAFTIYHRLAGSMKKSNPKFGDVFEQLAEMEHKHYIFWKKYTQDKEIKVNRFGLYLVLIMRRILGSAFAIKFLERVEKRAVKNYQSLALMIPPEDKAAFDEMVQDEELHENTFANQVQGSYVKYISFVVLGLADALVEIAGIHAGSLGIYDSTKLTGLAGIVAGAAASIAMASAAYAQARQGFEGSASLSAAYTGISYFVSAVLLALPYFITENMAYAISSSLVVGVCIIATTTYYNAVISSKGFTKDFAELAGIMFAATAALYVFGTVIRALTGITI